MSTSKQMKQQGTANCYQSKCNIAQRQQHVHTYIKKQLIYELCQTTKRSTGTPTGPVFWWKQDLLHWMDLKDHKNPLARVVQGKGV